MLKDQDRIFVNLYNDLGPDINSAIKRGDWTKTKEIISKGKEWIINEIKASELTCHSPVVVHWDRSTQLS